MQKYSAWLTKKFREWESNIGRRQSVSAFARYLDVNQASLSRWMNGDGPPNYENILKIADKLGPETYQVFDIETTVIRNTYIPEPLLRRIRSAIEEANLELSKLATPLDLDEAERITVAIFEKYGFNRKVINTELEEI